MKKTNTAEDEKENKRTDFVRTLSADPKMMIRFTDHLGVLQQMQLENLYADRNCDDICKMKKDRI